MQPFPFIILGIWLVFLIVWACSSVGVKRDVKKLDWWYSFFTFAIATSLALVGLYYLPLVPSTGIQGYFGVGFAALGIGLAIWARWHLGKNWSPAPALKAHHELVTSGPYHFIRHPIYTGLLLALLGSSIVSLPWVFILVGAGLLFIRRVGMEEHLMLQQFPQQYPAYQKQTKALLPLIW